MMIQSPIFEKLVCPFVMYWSPFEEKQWPRDYEYESHIISGYGEDRKIAICGYEPPNGWNGHLHSACVHPIVITCPKCQEKAKALFDNVKFQLWCFTEPVDGRESTTHNVYPEYATGLTELHSEIERVLMRGVNSINIRMVIGKEVKQ